MCVCVAGLRGEARGRTGHASETRDRHGGATRGCVHTRVKQTSDPVSGTKSACVLQKGNLPALHGTFFLKKGGPMVATSFELTPPGVACPYASMPPRRVSLLPRRLSSARRSPCSNTPLRTASIFQRPPLSLPLPSPALSPSTLCVVCAPYFNLLLFPCMVQIGVDELRAVASIPARAPAAAASGHTIVSLPYATCAYVVNPLNFSRGSPPPARARRPPWGVWRCGLRGAALWFSGALPHPRPLCPDRKVEIGQYNTEVVQLLAARPTHHRSSISRSDDNDKRRLKSNLAL